MRCRRRADSKYHRNLWEVACARLTEDEQKTLQAGLELPFEFDELRITIDNTRRRAESKWKVKGLHGREIDLHTHFDKIVVWIQRFVAIGDIIVQFDPAHAALPWAALRFVLEVLSFDLLCLIITKPTDQPRFVSMIPHEQPPLSMVSSRWRSTYTTVLFGSGSTSGKMPSKTENS